jgi:hypothetical protein
MEILSVAKYTYTLNSYRLNELMIHKYTTCSPRVLCDRATEQLFGILIGSPSEISIVTTTALKKAVKALKAGGRGREARLSLSSA